MDYSKMKWRVDQVPLASDVRVYYPDLKQNLLEHTNKIESQGISMNIFMRFVVLCYHQNSPLVDSIDDIVARKRKALMLLEQDPIDHPLMKPLNADIAYAVLQFLKFENNSKYKKKVLYEEALSKNQIDLIEATGTDRKNIPEAIERLESLIAKLDSETYSGDKDLSNYSESFEILEKRKILPEEQ